MPAWRFDGLAVEVRMFAFSYPHHIVNSSGARSVHPTLVLYEEVFLWLIPPLYEAGLHRL